MGQARKAREKAARRYKPEKIDLLLVAEAPPAALDRYLYFEEVWTGDSLFRHVYSGITGKLASRVHKADQLEELKELGVFLIDLKPDPLDGSDLRQFVPGLVARCRALEPQRIILVKANVFDLAVDDLIEAGLPVIEERIPFPGSGQQARFRHLFALALKGRPTNRPE